MGVQMSQIIDFSAELKWLPLHHLSVSRLAGCPWFRLCTLRFTQSAYHSPWRHNSP
jgi:hypothetical protein